MPNHSETKKSCRRDILRTATLAAVGGLLFDQIEADETTAMSNAKLSPDGAPAADIGYSPAILAEGKNSDDLRPRSKTKRPTWKLRSVKRSTRSASC